VHVQHDALFSAAQTSPSPAGQKGLLVPSVRLSTGIKGLDEILDGGLPAHSVYLVEGAPGAGKTTLALQFLLEGVRAGETGMYVALSETEEELRAVAQSHGWSLEGIHIVQLSTSTDALRLEQQYTVFHPSEVEPVETLRLMLNEVERLAPSRVVFDSMSEMRLLARDLLRYRRQILALKEFFIGRRCTVLLLDPGTPESNLQSICHGVVQLQSDVLEYGSEHRRLRVMKLRSVPFLGGCHDYVIRTGGIEVFPRIVAGDHQDMVAPELVSSGVRELDALLGGGLDRGTATLIIGPAGVGKSTITLQYVLAAAERGERAAVYTFDEGLHTLFLRAAALGMDLRGWVDRGQVTTNQIDPAEMSAGQFASVVRRAVNDGAKTIVIDSLNGYLNAMPEERALITQMHELLSYMNRHGVLTLMIVAQHGLVGTMMGTPVDLSYLADNVLLLRYFETAGEVRQAISVMKKRSGHHERTIREFRLGTHGVRVGESLSEFHGVLTGTPVYAGATVPRTGEMLREPR
jgi:circadian clock protein KaiC